MSNSLSFILCTFNKLSYLKITFPFLINSLQEDDELIVVDGGSVDGTKEYLETLSGGKRKFFLISEKDRGESHGFNKGLLLAKGELIKIISDDDVYFYPAINLCRNFMSEHPEIDIMAGNTGSVKMEDLNSLCCSFSFQEDYELWRKGILKNFFFNGTCLMLRRSSLNLMGLFNTNSLLADMEFTLRVTGFARISWCTGIIATRILNSQSNNMKYAERAKLEDKKLCQFYDYQHTHLRRKEALKKRSIYKKIRSSFSIFNALISNKKVIRSEISVVENNPTTFVEVYDYCRQWMTSHELNKDIRFLI